MDERLASASSPDSVDTAAIYCGAVRRPLKYLHLDFATRGEVTYLIGSQDLNAIIYNIDFIDTGWRPYNSPIRRQGMVEQLNKQCPFHAVVAYEHSRVIWVPIRDGDERISGPRH